EASLANSTQQTGIGGDTDGAPGGELDSAKRWKASRGIGADIGQRLERFVLVDHWDDDRQIRELHSWRTIGDVCAYNLPMTIRVLVIGAHRFGRRHGHWSKAHQHPYARKIMFRRKGDPRMGQAGEGWGTNWKQVWREDLRQVEAKDWLLGMARDKVLPEVAFERHVRVPEERQ